MKTITIQQPLAHLICAGIKDVENRTRKTNFRGRVFIRASSGDKFKVELTNAQMCAAFGQIFQRAQMEGYDFGAIIGSVEITDCIRNHPSIWAEKGAWNWVLKNPVLFPESIPCKGKQPFGEYSDIGTPVPDESGHDFRMRAVNVKGKAIYMADSYIDHRGCHRTVFRLRI